MTDKNIINKCWHMGIDIGVKNLSFCIIDAYTWKKSTDNISNTNGDINVTNSNSIDTNKYGKSGIIEWKNISLIEPSKKCSRVMKSGVTKGSLCGKNAKFQLIVDKLSKKDKDKDDSESLYCCGRHKCKDFEYKYITKTKVKSFSSVDLIKMAVKSLDVFKPLFEQVETILIELQPSMNPTMKSLSNSILTYFVIRYQIDTNQSILETVKFSSSKNKLKVAYDGPKITLPKKWSRYKITKTIGKIYTEHLLRNFPDDIEKFYKGSKKDDLADSFLHAVYSIGNCKTNLKSIKQ